MNFSRWPRNFLAIQRAFSSRRRKDDNSALHRPSMYQRNTKRPRELDTSFSAMTQPVEPSYDDLNAEWPMLEKGVYKLPIQQHEKLEEIQKQIRNNETPEIEILKHPDYFKVGEMFTVEDLFDARVHYGHKMGSLNDNMKPYLFGERLGHTIFDLDITAGHLRKALNFAAHIAYRDGIVLMICQHAMHSHLVEKAAMECGEYSHTRRYGQGILTNAKHVHGGPVRLPDLIILFNTKDTVLHQHRVVEEAAKLLIPTIGIVDSNCSPNLITYPVPGNDDTPVALALYCNLFKRAILKGKEERNQRILREKAEEEEKQNKSVSISDNSRSNDTVNK